MELMTAKGTKDYDPSTKVIINKIIKVIEKNFQRYGFLPLDTPIIEHLDLLKFKYDEDDEIVSEIFQLSDRGKRELGLRYDLTTPLCRFIAQNYKVIKKPFKRYQYGKVFRDGPIKKGRLREFIQFDGDVIGNINKYIEADLLTLYYEVYKELGLNVSIELNNYKILHGILLSQNYKKEELQSIILSIDKLKKIGETAVLKEIETKGIDSKNILPILKVLTSNDFSVIEKNFQNPLLKEGIDELRELEGLVKKKVNYKINLSLARGLAIYTGNVWEVYDNENSISSSLGGGGRYDRVIGEYLKTKEKIEAVGISFGIVPIYECLNSKKRKDYLVNKLIIPLKQKDKELENKIILKVRKLASSLRGNNQSVDIFYNAQGVQKAFEYAEYINAKEIIFIGNREIEQNFYTIKNISTKEETKIEYIF